jgi:hypothetical protein
LRNSVIAAGVEALLQLHADVPGPPSPIAACAAARRAIGTRYGEHDT